MIAKIKKFTEEVTSEMKKVSWPSKEHLWKSTQVVIVVTILITAIVSLMDYLVSNGVDLLFESFGS